jgi:peroxiredoxin
MTEPDPAPDTDPGSTRSAANAAAGRADPQRPRHRRLVLAALAVACGAGAWVTHRWRGASRRPASLPDLSYPVIDGRRIGPAELRGKVVLVNFWATRCGVCIAEMPELSRLYRDFAPRGLELIAIAMPYDRPDHVLHVADTRRLPFPVALDPMGAAVAAWGGVEATPMSWLVATDGRVVRQWLGRPDFVRLRREIEGLLAARAA